MATDLSYNGRGATIADRSDYKDDPHGQFQYWQKELDASKRARRKWHKDGSNIVKRFVDARRDQDFDRENQTRGFRLNLFHTNVSTLQSLLYSNLPKVQVDRRYFDQDDDVARVAADILERLLNTDIAENGEEYDTVMRSCLLDRLLAGLGCARVRYEVETETISETVAEVEPQEDGEVEVEGEQTTIERMVAETAPCDYFHWRDVLWGWGRSFRDLPWIAFRSFLSKDEARELFGKEAANAMSYQRQLVTNKEDDHDIPELDSAWLKTEVWEVWDKTKRQVVFINLSGPERVLKTVDDPLQLKNFYPTPPFLLANATTDIYQPTPDFHLTRDLYNEIDELQTRISIITEAVRVVGVYNSEEANVARMFKEGVENTLIPVENWAMFGEKGGLEGAIDWFPVRDVVETLDKLRQLRDETIGLLYQQVGITEVMMGGTAGQYEGTGQIETRAKFGSVRVQKLQDDIAQFATDMLQIKAEIIVRHFEPETILKMSNMEHSLNRDLAMQAIELLKQPNEAKMRVEITSDSVAMIDYAQLKQERTEYLTAVATFLQSAAPMMEQEPESAPALFTMLKWGLAGFKGSNEIEGVIDKAIDAAAVKAAQPQEAQPDPALQLEQVKQQGELGKIGAKAEADMATRNNDLQADQQTIMVQHQAKMAEIRAELEKSLAETQAKLEADVLVEQVQAATSIEQKQAEVEGEMIKDTHQARLDTETELVKSASKINEIGAASASKMKEATVSED